MSTRSTASAVSVMREVSDPSIASRVAGSSIASSSSATCAHADSNRPQKIRSPAIHRRPCGIAALLL